MTNLPKNPKPNFEKILSPSTKGEAKYVSKRDLDKAIRIIEENKKIEAEIKRRENAYLC